ncbi:odorant receptor 67b-like [Leptopilina boulardi]|uniref:odorant receptor 67b-like n=1 Tax=Leptopilina boulardi TaxID=63433 RepID=UPI0021F69C57|nr:odorant receptor 67b-like [Leptopilina boulardi]
MDVYESRYFKINKLALFVIGQWVYQTVAMKIITRILILLSLTSAIIPQFNFLFSVVGNSDATFECLPPILLVLLCYFQFAIFTIKQGKLRILVKHMENDWNFWTSKIERTILLKTAKHGNRLTILYAINMYSSVLIFISMSMAPIVFDHFLPLNETRPRLLVYAAKFPLDENKYLSWLLVHGSITSLCNLTVMFACESMFAVTTQHVCGLFAIVSHHLKNIIKDANKEQKYIIIKDSMSYEQLRSSIKWHNHALQYSKTLNSCFSPLLFWSVGLNVIAISSLLIQTLNSIGTFTLAIKYGIFASACLIHLFCLTLPAQNLLDSSLLVSRGTYNGEWYNLPLYGQKLLVPIILRGQIPSTLTVGKFCTMDMIAFATLLKTSVSYFTVLSSMR